MSDAPVASGVASIAPPLRQELELIAAAPDINGAQRWLIYDPLQHKFTAIGQGAHALLQVWGEGKTIEQLISDAWEHHSEALQPDDIAQFFQFLQASRLTLDGPDGGWRSLAMAAAKSRGSLATHVLHTYLFFRIPLLRPERFLRATLAFVRPFSRRGFGVFIAVTGTAGLYLVSREWDEFRATFSGVATFEGAALLSCALMLVKLLHELGHAYVATALGCRVPVLGVAFILGAPLLYCDVTDAWRLKSRWARLRVDSAGILADLSVASLATFLWAFLPPGLAKHFAFSLATAGWILSLTMNLNPFMKFDGYHIASSLIGIENMQDRAVELGRWRLREFLFAIGAKPPERLPQRMAIALIIYAWLLWLYRLVVFTGIAFVVYHLFFKLAGLTLFAVEIGYFVIAPIVRELKEWWRMRHQIAASGRFFITATVLAVFAALLVMPLSTTVRIPAILTSEQLTRLYPALPARVDTVHVATGDRVAAGQKLISLASTDIEQELVLNRLRSAVVAMRLDRGTGDSDDRADTVVLENEQAALRQHAGGLIRQRNELDIVAPFAGRVVEMLPALHVNRTLGPREALLAIRGERGGAVRGALDERDLWRLKVGTPSVFVPNDLAIPGIEVRIHSVSQSAMAVIAPAELAASQGGPVADRLDANHQPVPVTAQYAVIGNVDGQLPDVLQRRSTAGILVTQGAPESFISGIWRQILKVLVRESGL